MMWNDSWRQIVSSLKLISAMLGIQLKLSTVCAEWPVTACSLQGCGIVDKDVNLVAAVDFGLNFL